MGIGIAGAITLEFIQLICYNSELDAANTRRWWTLPKTQYQLFHDQAICHDICAPMTQQFCGTMKDKIISLPPDIGTGYYRYISPCKNMEMYISDVTFNKNTTLGEQTHRDAFSISFCFSDTLEWGNPSNQSRSHLEKGDCCIYKNGSYKMENYYEAGQRYIGIGLNLYPCRFRAITDCLLEKKALISPEQPVSEFRRYKVTKSVEAILHQILRCNYIDNLKSLYLEGKILELAAAFANEVILEKDLAAVRRELSLSDNAALSRIRRIIEENVTEPLTIAGLAKQSFMSESKLREVFRQQYGVTIYQYILERRMEKAREYLMQQNCRVKEAASLVGYSNISHFSEAFRKKFGCTPSEYIKSNPL